jgi:hypothetical protein
MMGIEHPFPGLEKGENARRVSRVDMMGNGKFPWKFGRENNANRRDQQLSNGIC